MAGSTIEAAILTRTPFKNGVGALVSPGYIPG
jgi:hypothetical protein